MCIMSHDAYVNFTAGHSYKSKNKPNKHGFIYKNSVETEGKCAMILPIPTTDAASLEVIDTTDFAPMMDEFKDQAQGWCRSVGMDSEILQCGIYTLAVGRDIQNINGALGVALKPQLCDWLLAHYPAQSFTFISCVWEGDMNAQPIQVEYTPTWESHLFFPMMEAHGEIPVDKDVKRNHYLTVSTGESSDSQFQHAPDWLFKAYFGYALKDTHSPNGDLYIHIEKYSTIWDSDRTNIVFEADPFALEPVLIDPFDPNMEPNDPLEYFQWLKKQSNK